LKTKLLSIPVLISVLIFSLFLSLVEEGKILRWFVLILLGILIYEISIFFKEKPKQSK
jgi:hypothetical protein